MEDASVKEGRLEDIIDQPEGRLGMMHVWRWEGGHARAKRTNHSISFICVGPEEARNISTAAITVFLIFS